MKIYVNEITGIADAIVSMFMSRRSWTREKELEIRGVCERVLTREGRIRDLNIAIPCLLAIFVPLGAVVAFDYFFLTPEKDSLGL